MAQAGAVLVNNASGEIVHPVSRPGSHRHRHRPIRWALVLPRRWRNPVAKATLGANDGVAQMGRPGAEAFFYPAPPVIVAAAQDSERGLHRKGDRPAKANGDSAPIGGGRGRQFMQRLRQSAMRHLQTVQSEIAEDQRQLDQAEAESATLRDLAACFNADNALRLNLETYAIGAMFDQVLLCANRRLGPMTGGWYSLERETEDSGGRARRGLGIRVFDVYTGKPRQKALLDLDPWLARAPSSLVASFASGVAKDRAVVAAAILSPWSNGQTEGQITKLKLAKRQMYGRGKIDLLQARVIGLQ
ncbi:hypothetical protein M2322_004796 [Rhodoblastus acidophilus]|nr:hypothetical protein [Rhodoblastus acidophilus]